MMKYDIPYILGAKFDHRKYIMRGSQIEGLEIQDDLGPITLADLEAADLELQKVEYKTLRSSKYPSLNDVIVALIENEEGRPEALEALKILRAEVKALYPKPVK